jgi:hypothetical protein
VKALEPVQHRSRIIDGPEGIDHDGEAVIPEDVPDVLGETGSHHQTGHVMIQVKGIVRKFYLCQEFHALELIVKTNIVKICQLNDRYL